jgi:hypothetical protein
LDTNEIVDVRRENGNDSIKTHELRHARSDGAQGLL